MNPELLTTISVWIADVSTIVWQGPQTCPDIRKVPLVPERYTDSLAHGPGWCMAFFTSSPRLAGSKEVTGRARAAALKTRPTAMSGRVWLP